MNKFSKNRVKGFLHTDGRKMVNGDEETIVLRGWGAGNWMNPEGFMIGGPPMIEDGMNLYGFMLPRRFERGRSVESTVRELCGTDFAREFQRKWIDNYLSEEDIAMMAKMGYNSVRLPVSARLFLKEEPGICWIEENFTVLERVLEWCEKYKLYAILDLHAAPGGQSALACDDGLDNRPHTFTEPESRERTMRLWEEFAKRYAQRWIIGGYDLLNEPLSGPGCLYLIPELSKFYDELIERIRKYDRNHMLTLEGAGFSLDMDIFDHEYDTECKNWCIHTHIYDFSPEVKDLYRFFESSLKWNVPIWIGEGGSTPIANSIFYEIAGTYDIGYALWSWKSAGITGSGSHATVTYSLPKEWELIRDYICNGGPRPSYEKAGQILAEMLDNILLKHCKVEMESNYYNLRQPGIKLPAIAFDEEQGSYLSKGWEYGNPFGYRTETGMKMVLRPGVLCPQKLLFPPMEPQVRNASPLSDLCLELREGEFVTYTIRDIEKPCKVSVEARVCGEEQSGQLAVYHDLNNETRKKEITIWDHETKEVIAAQLSEAEEAKVRIQALSGGLQIDTISFLVNDSLIE